MIFQSDILNDMKIITSDGEIGKLSDFYFDDEKWVVRHLVVETGKLLGRKTSLISPISFKKVDFADRTITINSSRGQIESSPDYIQNEPVSRKREREFYTYYQWPFYWTGLGIWGLGPYGVPWIDRNDPLRRTGPHDHPDFQPKESIEGDQDDIHLRSGKEVRGYRIEANNEEKDFGNVENFLVDDRNWAIRFLVIDTVNWWPSKKVLLPPQWIKSILWPEKRVQVDLEKEKIKSAPAYDPGRMDQNYEKNLFDHYNRQDPWEKGYFP